MPVATPPAAIIHHAKPASHLIVRAVVSPSPALPGKVETLTVTITQDRKPVTDAHLTADVNMTDMDMGVTHPPFKSVSPGVYTTSPEFTMAGQWRIIVHAKVPGAMPVTKVVLVEADS